MVFCNMACFQMRKRGSCLNLATFGGGKPMIREDGVVLGPKM
jgi:hypothetical protein